MPKGNASKRNKRMSAAAVQAAGSPGGMFARKSVVNEKGETVKRGKKRKVKTSRMSYGDFIQ